MTNATIPLSSWNRFLTRNFAIEVDLAGGAHEFAYDNYRIRVELPPKSDVPTEPCEDGRLSFNGYFTVDGCKVPSCFHVTDVDILVHSTDEVTIPEEILGRPPIAIELISKPKQVQLESMANTLHLVAEKAFDRWIRTLRWKCNNSSIGRPAVDGHKSGWSTYLIEMSRHHRYWIATQTFHVPASRRISSLAWRNTELVLQQGIESPISVDMMFDGIEHMALGDYARATIDFAVACETFLRSLVADALPAALPPSIRDFLDEANVRPVLGKFVPDVLNECDQQQLKAIQNSLNKLFDTRNKIVHKGEAVGLLPSECQKYLEATRSLLSIRHTDISEPTLRSTNP